MELLDLFYQYTSTVRKFEPKFGGIYQFFLEKKKFISSAFEHSAVIISIFFDVETPSPEQFTTKALSFCDTIIGYFSPQPEKLDRFKSFLKSGVDNSFAIYPEFKDGRINLRILDRSFYAEYAKFYLACEARKILNLRQRAGNFRRIK